MRSTVGLAVLAGMLLAASGPALAQGTPDTASAQALKGDIERLRQELAAIQQQYGERLASLEARLTALEGAANAAPPPTPAAEPAAAPPPPAQAPESPPPGYNAAAASKVFNPDMSMIGNFVGVSGRDPVDTAPAFSLSEAEMALQAVVDPYARADFYLSFSPEGVSVEEGFITFTALPGGLVMKAGQLREAFGKVNTMHTHVMPWVDRPLIMTNLFGSDEGIKDAGVSVAKLIQNPWLFLEATGEVYAGTSGLFTNDARDHLSYIGRVRAYRDLTESTNLDVGTSLAWGYNETGDNRHTRLAGVDATFRYRPLRRAIYTRALARAELVWSRREQPDGVVPAFGMYASGEYQFARRWVATGRVDYSARAVDAALKDKGISGILTFWPSEFSQVRGQYRRVRYAEGWTGNEFLFQFLFAIGAHGAHVF